MDSSSNSDTPRIQSFLKTFKIIHLALVMGVTFFGVFAWMQLENVKYGMDENDFYTYIVPIAALIGYFASKTIFQRIISTVKVNDATSTKLGKYQTASLIKYAFLEGPALLAFFAFMHNGNALYLSIGIGLWILLVYERPTKEKLEQQLPLTLTEKQNLKP